MNAVTLYHGNHQFENEQTELNISPDYVQAQLAREYEKQKEAGTLDEVEIWWGIMIVKGTKREFVLDYEGIKLVELPQEN